MAEGVTLLGKALPSLLQLAEPQVQSTHMVQLELIAQMANDPDELIRALEQHLKAAPREQPRESPELQDVHVDNARRTRPEAPGSHTATSDPTSPAMDYVSPSPGLKRSRTDKQHGERDHEAAGTGQGGIAGLTLPSSSRAGTHVGAALPPLPPPPRLMGPLR